MNKTIGIIGGDLRQVTIAQLLQKEGFNIYIYGFDKNIECQDLNITNDLSVIENCNIIILPVPVSYDGININAPFAIEDIPLKDMFSFVKQGSIIVGGKITGPICQLATKKGALCCDYMEREELSIKNAIATSEGAIKIAIEETPITLWGSKCLIIGYGRIGKVLSKMLSGIGADVSVSARKQSDIAWISERRFIPVPSNNLINNMDTYDIIFNTVPSVILDEAHLKKVKKGSLIIDLASKPGGVDFSMAKKLGLNVIWALSLPGKIAPVTSGAIIKDTIINILNEMEV